jgi:hypothetical protein
MIHEWAGFYFLQFLTIVSFVYGENLNLVDQKNLQLVLFFYFTMRNNCCTTFVRTLIKLQQFFFFKLTIKFTYHIYLTIVYNCKFLIWRESEYGWPTEPLPSLKEASLSCCFYWFRDYINFWVNNIIILSGLIVQKINDTLHECSQITYF